MKSFMIVLTLITALQLQAASAPDPALTPGVLCTSSDPDYKGPDYPEGIARCNRNIADPEKVAVAAKYGNIPRSEWANYEFDHLIPLCAGGSNSSENLWPQPIDEAKQKDVLEVDICTKMRAGTLKQADAILQVRNWFASRAGSQPSGPTPIPTPAPPEPTQTGPAVTPPVVTSPIPGRILCTEVSAQPNSSPLLLEFTNVGDGEIQDPQVRIVDSIEQSEVTSAAGTVTGKLSRAKSAPLQGLYLFTVIENQDRFDLYLPAQRAQTFRAFIKLSFEDTYPKLVPVSCQNNL